MQRPSRRRTSETKKAALRKLPRLEDIPNIGPAVAADLRQLGIAQPDDLLGRDPYTMFEDLCRITGQRHDPCLLDTFIAAVRFMSVEPKQPWWKYTSERKKVLAARKAAPKSENLLVTSQATCLRT